MIALETDHLETILRECEGSFDVGGPVSAGVEQEGPSATLQPAGDLTLSRSQRDDKSAVIRLPRKPFCACLLPAIWGTALLWAKRCEFVPLAR